MEPLQSTVSVGELFGKMKVANITIENARFWGRPNFSGDPEADRFKDPRRKFTVEIPNELADQMRALGWNVKTTIPSEEDVALGREPISSLKVMVDDAIQDAETKQWKGPNITVIQGEQSERLSNTTMGLLDKSRIDSLDMEIRAWEFNESENPGEFSARLVTLVAVIRPNLLSAKYGRLLS